MTRGLCLQCRTAFPAGHRCDGAGHVTIDLATDRETLVSHVWGELPERVEALRRVYRVRVNTAQAVAAGLGVGLVASLTLGLGFLPTFALISGASVTLARYSDRRARRDAPVHPRGAEPLPTVEAFGRGRIFVAKGDSAPVSGGQGAAWALELRYEGGLGSRVMLRAGATAGLGIELESGEQVRLEAGPLRVVGTLRQVGDHDVAELEAYLRQVDPGRSLAGELCPAIPFNVIGETLLQVGDRVELYGIFEPAVLAGSAALYREAPATILVPRGVPTLRPLR